MRLLPILTAVSIASFAIAATANAQGMNGDQNGMGRGDSGMSSGDMGHPMMHKKMHRKHTMMHKKMMPSDQHM